MYLFQSLVQVFTLLLLFPLLLQQSVPPAHFWCSTSLKFLFQAPDIHYFLFSFIFIYLSELSGRIGQSGIRTRQFCRAERELPFSRLLSKLVVLSVKRRFDQKQFSIPRLDALHFSSGGPVRPAVPYGQRLTRVPFSSYLIARHHLVQAALLI